MECGICNMYSIIEILQSIKSESVLRKIGYIFKFKIIASNHAKFEIIRYFMFITRFRRWIHFVFLPLNRENAYFYYHIEYDT